jgi:uncharacterized DUF497 family protein
MIDFDKIEGFEWDKGNIDKNWIIHQVSNAEAEQVLFNEPLIVSDDERHSSESEKRYSALGKTDNEKKINIIFTIRGKLIRIISARKMSKKERKVYNEETQKNT